MVKFSVKEIFYPVFDYISFRIVGKKQRLSQSGGHGEQVFNGGA